MCSGSRNGSNSSNSHSDSASNSMLLPPALSHDTSHPSVSSFHVTRTSLPQSHPLRLRVLPTLLLVSVSVRMVFLRFVSVPLLRSATLHTSALPGCIIRIRTLEI